MMHTQKKNVSRHIFSMKSQSPLKLISFYTVYISFIGKSLHEKSLMMSYSSTLVYYHFEPELFTTCSIPTKIILTRLIPIWINSNGEKFQINSDHLQSDQFQHG